MGNYISYKPSGVTGKVILFDGSVQEFDKPITVAELMLEHPQQVVVEFNSAISGKKPIPLPADKRLETEKVYVMLPMKRGGKAMSLTSEEASHVLITANSILKSKTLLTSSKFLPLFDGICGAGIAQSPLVIQKKHHSLVEKPLEGYKEFMSETLEFRPEFLGRQLSERGWKPSLDTIIHVFCKSQKRCVFGCDLCDVEKGNVVYED
ncbi:PADRE domain [Dillenia turbinata]|uniref:PADRE domain n=1 Tax=Dillenia turbinata TaxID=194707 RepID=A0AAN8VWY9_9MAGN